MSNNIDLVRIYLEEISTYPLLSREEEKELFHRMNNNSWAREQLINCNLRLVVSIAKGYVCETVDLLDMIQCGNEGLIFAIDTFDINKDSRLSTYAYRIINQYISKYIKDCSRTIRIPVMRFELYNKINTIIDDFNSKYGCIPNENEISEMLGIPASRVLEVINYFSNMISLSTPVGNSEDNCCTFEDIIPDNYDLEEDVYKRFCNNDIVSIFEFMSFKEKFVIGSKYGFIDGKIHTYREIANILGITGSGVKYIHDNVLEKIRRKKKTLCTESY